MEYYSYLINLFAIEQVQFYPVGRPRNVEVLKGVKVGETKFTPVRYPQLLRNPNYDISRIEVVREFAFSSENFALIFEDVMREILMRKYPSNFVKKDRFEDIALTKEDLQVIDLAYLKFSNFIENAF